jgi:hypothetical protein
VIRTILDAEVQLLKGGGRGRGVIAGSDSIGGGGGGLSAAVETELGSARDMYEGCEGVRGMRE